MGQHITQAFLGGKMGGTNTHIRMWTGNNTSAPPDHRVRPHGGMCLCPRGVRRPQRLLWALRQHTHHCPPVWLLHVNIIPRPSSCGCNHPRITDYPPGGCTIGRMGWRAWAGKNAVSRSPSAKTPALYMALTCHPRAGEAPPRRRCGSRATSGLPHPRSLTRQTSRTAPTAPTGGDRRQALRPPNVAPPPPHPVSRCRKTRVRGLN